MRKVHKIREGKIKEIMKNQRFMNFKFKEFKCSWYLPSYCLFILDCSGFTANT